MPWFTAGEDKTKVPTSKVGDVAELQVYDDAQKPQGTILVGVKEADEVYRGSTVLKGFFPAAQDLSFHWWMNEGERAPSKSDGDCHLCLVKSPGCLPSLRRPKMTHSDSYQNLGQKPLTARQVPWLNTKVIMEGFKKRLGMFQGLAIGRGESMTLQVTTWQPENGVGGGGEPGGRREHA